MTDTDFAQSFDALDWARAFASRFMLWQDGGVLTQEDCEGLMLGWFANAIMRGWDEHARRYSPTDGAEAGA
jgi:hypothetical protein